jgi:SAM-dependent methyltransferase
MEPFAMQPFAMQPVPPTGHWHDDYERGRPGWPPEVVDVPALPATATVLDLGAGTGKLTRLLASRFERVIAVEPDDGMRAVLSSTCPSVEILAGSAELLPVEDGSIDAVFAAEAFHTFDDGAALVEIERVLAPRGALVLMWNLPAGPTTPSIAAAERLLLDRAPAGLGHDPVDLNTRRYASGAWRAGFEEGPFEELREERFPNPQTVDRDGLVAFFESMGWIGNLPEAERLRLLEQVQSLLEAPAYHRVWETRLHWARVAA